MVHVPVCLRTSLVPVVSRQCRRCCSVKVNGSVSLFLGCLTTEMMLSPLHSIVAERTTGSSSSGGGGGRGTWRRCKMEEAVVRWLCHVSGCFLQAFHPSFLSPPVRLSFSASALFLLLRAVGEGLSLVSLSPTSSSNLSVHSAYSLQWFDVAPRLVVLSQVKPHVFLSVNLSPCLSC